MKPIFHLKLDDPMGGINQNTAYDVSGDLLHMLKIEPPVPDLDNFDTCVQRMKLRDERRRRFAEIGRMLGALIAERMEDAEGWHGQDRQIKMMELKRNARGY